MAPPSPLPLHGRTLSVTARPLTPAAFAPFGDVVQNPRPDVHPAQYADADADAAAAAGPLPYDAVAANQGSAIKYQHVARLANTYDRAPSGVPAVPVMNLFVCAARSLSSSSSFEVTVLERHPFTTQTFSPISATAARQGLVHDRRPHAYLVIVAPSRAPSASPRQDGEDGGKTPTNPPDLANVQAFVATTNQAVTYAAGTWHAPMVALGPAGSTVDFVVAQFANGVADDDCQEVTFGARGRNDGAIHVLVPVSREQQPAPSRL